MPRIGILGGTFDPPHNGHIALALAALNELGLEKVLFIPARIPPHKSNKVVSSKEDRLAMLELALTGHDQFEISRLELDREGTSYTIDTLKKLKKTLPGIDLYFLIGADNISEIENWHQPEKIFKEAIIAAAGRPGFIPGGKFAGQIEMFKMNPTDISSSGIREKIGGNRPVTGLLPPAVEQYIEKKGLYKKSE